jgi:hypothetical protein
MDHHLYTEYKSLRTQARYGETIRDQLNCGNFLSGTKNALNCRCRTCMQECPNPYNVLFLYSWKGGNGFSTRMVPKLQITSGEATSDL